MADFSKELPDTVTLMTKAARCSETSINIYKNTWRDVPDDSHLQLQNIPIRYKILQNTWATHARRKYQRTQLQSVKLLTWKEENKHRLFNKRAL
jgi:hypothetical protein